MNSEKAFIFLVALFLIAEIIQVVVESNAVVKKHVQSNPFLNFVYQDAVGYVHIFEKTEMPNTAKLNGVIDAVLADAKRHGYKVTDEDRSLIEGAVEYAVNKMHLANADAEKQSPQVDVDITTNGNAKSVDGLEEKEINTVVPDAPQLPQLAEIADKVVSGNGK